MTLCIAAIAYEKHEAAVLTASDLMLSTEEMSIDTRFSRRNICPLLGSAGLSCMRDCPQ